MRQIFLLLDEIETGPMSVHDVLARVEEGRAGAETAYWEDGLEDWEPLNNLLPGLSVQVVESNDGAVEIATNPQCRVEDGEKEISPERLARSATRPPAPRMITGPLSPPSAAEVDASLRRVQDVLFQSRKAERSGRFVLMAWFFALVAAGAAFFHFMPAGWIVMVAAAALGVVFGLVGLCSGRYFGGLIAMLAAAGLPGVLYPVAKARDIRPAMFTDIEKAVSDRKDAQPGFKDVKLEVAGDQRRLSGIVQTVSSGEPEALQVLVSWLDADRNVVAESVIPLANGEPVPPGAAAKFAVDAPADPAVRSYTTVIAPLQ